MAVVGGGAQAELAIVHERAALPVPDTLDLLEAGGFPEAFTVAHDALFTQCALRPGERVLVNGAAGGVGVAARPACPYGGRHGRRERAGRLTFERRSEIFGATAIDPGDAAAHGPYDVILEPIGAPNLKSDLDSLAIGGRIAIIGVGAGARGEIDLMPAHESPGPHSRRHAQGPSSRGEGGRRAPRRAPGPATARGAAGSCPRRGGVRDGGSGSGVRTV